MKNILIISSSPRKKGNSQILCEQFKKGAEAKGHQVKIVRIMEQNIGFCRACDGCMRNGGTCVLKDDMAEILKMFQKADVLVLATPVYFYGISAQMKTFIDRTYPIWQHLGKKEDYYIISAGLGEDIEWFCRASGRIQDFRKDICSKRDGCWIGQESKCFPKSLRYGICHLSC